MIARLRHREALFWALLALELAGFLGWHLGRLQGFQWGSDEGIYMMRVRLMQQGFRLYRDIWTDQLPGLIEALRAAMALWGNDVAVGRALVVLLAGVGLAGTALLARLLAGRVGALAVIPLVSLVPNYFWLARAVVSPDLPSISLGVAGLAAAGYYVRGHKRGWLVVSGLLCAAGIYVKATAALAVLPAGLWLLAAWWRGQPHTWASWWRSVGLWGAWLLLPFAFALAWHDLPALWRQFVGTQVSSGALELKIGAHAIKIGAYLQENALGLVALALAGSLAAVPARRRWAWVPGVWLGISLAALLVRSPMWPSHHLVVLLYPLGVLGACALAELWRGLVVRQVTLGSAAAGLALLVFVALLPRAVAADGLLKDAGASQSSEEAIALLRQRFPEGAVVISDYQMIPYRAGCSAPPELATVTKKRLQLGLLSDAELMRITEAQAPPAVLFWDEQLASATEYMHWVKQRYVLAYKHNYHEVYVRLADELGEPYRQEAQLGEALELVGYGLPRPAVLPGEPLEVVLLWRADAPIPDRLNGFVHLIGADGQAIAQEDHLAWGEQYPSTLWAAGETIVDRYRLLVPEDAPPGPYTLSVGLYDSQSKRRLVVNDAAGQPLAGNQIVLATRPVVQTAQPGTAELLSVSSGYALGQVARLRSYALDSEDDRLLVRLQWQALAPPARPGYTVFVQLREGDSVVAQHDGLPSAGLLPSYAWRPGEIVLDEHLLDTSALAAGDYDLFVGLYDAATGQRLQVSDTRGVAVPNAEIALGAVRIGGVRLEGAP
jgi:hypothetical protein